MSQVCADRTYLNGYCLNPKARDKGLKKQGVCMIETAEGIGSRKWSYEIEGTEGSHTDPAKFVLCQGVSRLAVLTPFGEKCKLLIATAPQLWATANDLLVLEKNVQSGACPAGMLVKGFERLSEMVAKAVGKQEWTKVLQE